MRSVFFLLKRYLFPRQGDLLSFALWISVAGVALGIVQLMLVLSVMSGFLHVFEENYTNITSQIVVLPSYDLQRSPQFAEKVRSVPGVAAITPFNMGQGMVLKNGVAGVVLEGIDVKSSEEVTPWKKIWVEGPLWDMQAKNPDWIWIGKQLADKLHIKLGETVNLLISENGRNKVIPFTVTSITKFGIYDHDLRSVRIDLDVLNEKFGRQKFEPLYKIRVEPGQSVDTVAERLRRAVGTSSNVREWRELNENIFLAVQNQKGMLFLVLEIVVALAGVNVINLLMMSSHHRKRDLAILRAMGMKRRHAFSFFLFQGAAVGLAGIGTGLVAGLIACRLAERFQPAILSEAIYNVTKLPFRTEPRDMVVISIVAFCLCVVFSMIPAFRAMQQRPVEALRYE